MRAIILGLFVLSACSVGTVQTGGEKSYIYDVQTDYTVEELHQFAPEVITTLWRDPSVGKLNDIFAPGALPLKKVGIIVFESRIQPTLDGMAGHDKVYLSAQGKQLLTERFLRVWDESFPVLNSDIDYVSTKHIKQSKQLHLHGMEVDDHIHSKRVAIAPDDIFYIHKGKLAPGPNVHNPRNMQDVSFVLVPAVELMHGPKFSEHNKQFVNSVAREMKLDAVIVVLSEVFWTAARVDKNSGDVVPEEMTMKIHSSVLLPAYRYNERLAKMGRKELGPNQTLCYRAYESKLKFPVLLSVPQESENFQTIEKEILNPMLKAYKDLSQMNIIQMGRDLRKTF